MGIGESFAIILREFPYALFGSMLVGMVCGFLGVYIVARRVVFLGAVLTQISVLGLALTFLPALAMPHTVGSLAVTLVAVILLSRLLTGRKIPQDAVLGFVFVASIALRILVMQETPQVEVAEIENLLRGDILFVTPEVFYTMLVVSVLVMGLHMLFFKEFSYVAFDPETAGTQGFKAGGWDMLFYVIAALTIATATHMVGDIFVFGFLVLPPLAALLVARRVVAVFLISMLIGILAPIVGLLTAFRFDYPSSPAAVAVAAVLLALFWIAGLLRRR